MERMRCDAITKLGERCRRKGKRRVATGAAADREKNGLRKFRHPPGTFRETYASATSEGKWLVSQAYLCRAHDADRYVSVAVPLACARQLIDAVVNPRHYVEGDAGLLRGALRALGGVPVLTYVSGDVARQVTAALARYKRGAVPSDLEDA